MTKVAIIGLGNPGPTYHRTRHNVGFWLLDRFAKENNFTFRFDSKSDSEISENLCYERKIMLIKPMSFMNESGSHLPSLLRSNGYENNPILVLHDELTLPLGGIKISSIGKGSGGHNGIKSIIDSVGNVFIRIRIGIGAKKIPEQTLSEYVLSKFSNEESLILENNKLHFLGAIQLVIEKGVDVAMNLLNQEKQTQITP